MSSVFVVLQKTNRSDIRKILDGAIMETGLEKSSYANTLVIQNVGFSCHFSEVTSKSHDEKMPYLDPSTGCCVVADARIDYRAELIGQFGSNIQQAEELPDCRLILQSYLHWGDACAKHLYGDFAFVIWDPSRNRLFCARDHFGCRPLFYVDKSDFIAISSNPLAFKALPGFGFRITDQFILDAICSIVPNRNDLTFLGVNRIPPAHTFVVSKDLTMQLHRYWDLKVQDENEYLTEEEAAKDLRDLFFKAVTERSRSLAPVGVELSGGLDSSGIATCLAQVIDKEIPVYALSHTLWEDQDVRPRSYKDEYLYGSKIASFNQLSKHIAVDGENEEGSYAAIINYLNLMMRPTVQAFAMMSDLLYDQACQTGVRVLLSGFGGDEGVTYNGGGLLEELAARKDFDKLKEVLKSRIKRRGGNFYRQLTILYFKKWVPGLMKLFKADWRRSRFRIFAFDRRIGQEFGMRKRYLKRVQIPSDHDVRKRQYKRIMHPHVTDRLENSYFLAKDKGIEYRYPFLDVKLIEFYYSLPSEYKYKNGTGRYLFRMAMEGILPDEIRLREDKTGATIPNVMYRIVKDEDIFRELIEEGRENNKIHYVDYDKLQWMIEQFKHEEKRKKMNFGPRAFLSPMSVLILQKWQREGKIDIGIKC